MHRLIEIEKVSVKKTKICNQKSVRWKDGIWELSVRRSLGISRLWYMRGSMLLLSLLMMSKLPRDKG